MILLFGASGYIGTEFKKQLENLNLDTYYWKNTTQTTYDDLEKWYDTEHPTISFVINCAGYVGKPNVDMCEFNKDSCIKGNVLWHYILTEWCKKHNLPLGNVSSGCVFLGKKENGDGWSEDDEPNFSFKHNNCSFYSGTKVLGEEIVKKHLNSYIWRLRIPFSSTNVARNYFSKMLNYKYLLDAENSLSNKEEFVSACINMIINKAPYGIYNVTNPGYIDTKWLITALKNTIAPNHEFKLITEEELYTRKFAIAPRSSCVLDTKKVESLGIKLTPVKESIMKCLTILSRSN